MWRERVSRPNRGFGVLGLEKFGDIGLSGLRVILSGLGTMGAGFECSNGSYVCENDMVGFGSPLQLGLGKSVWGRV